MSATEFLESLCEDDLRQKLTQLEAERKALMVLLRAVRTRRISQSPHRAKADAEEARR